MQTSIDAVDLDSLPRTISVQSSYKLNLPPYLLIHAVNIKLVEPIGQGDYRCYCYVHACSILVHVIIILGEFGIVYKGYIVEEQESIVTDTVAIKTLKGIDIVYPYGGASFVFLLT